MDSPVQQTLAIVQGLLHKDEMELDSETRDFVHRMLFFTPQQSVKRVVFISTPHRGSYLTKNWVRDLIRSIIYIPVNITLRIAFMTKTGSSLKPPESIKGRILTSIDGMSQENPILKALVSLPLAPGVIGHSIIAVKPGMDILTGNDGVVEYKSAHIDGVESELIVRAEHSCQDHPFTIEDVRRILLEHIGISSGWQTLPASVSISAELEKQ